MKAPLLPIVVMSIATLVAACGPDPNSLTGGGGRTARRTSGGTTSSDGTQADDGSGDGTQTGATGGSTPGTPSTNPDSTPGGSSGSTPGNGGATPPPTTSSTAEQTCVDTINQYRAKLSLPPLARWTAIETCSDSEAASDGQTNRAHGAFPKCGENAQNECPGWPGAPAQMIGDCLKAMWDEGPGGGHHDNMASTQWTQVSCGFSTLPSGAVWAVQNFK
jgi:hypothetical protein